MSVLIEHPRAIENLDEILNVVGLRGDCCPLDLAVNMGHTDGPNHQGDREALAAASKKIATKGFPIASFAVTPAQGIAALEAGCQLLFLGFDVMFVPAAIQLYLAQLQDSAS